MPCAHNDCRAAICNGEAEFVKCRSVARGELLLIEEERSKDRVISLLGAHCGPQRLVEIMLFEVCDGRHALQRRTRIVSLGRSPVESGRLRGTARNAVP